MKVLEQGSSGAPVSDVSIGSGELWYPPKELHKLMESIVREQEPNELLIREVDKVLTRHSADFASLFGIKPPNPVDREELKKCGTEGAYLKGYSGKRVIAYSLINEAMLISDLFQVNEFLALDLLTMAENEIENYPAWPRGLIAVHMFYEGRYWLIDSLTTIIRLCPGRTWLSRLHPNILQLFRRCLSSVFRDDMVERLIALLDNFNLERQMEILETNLALGDWRHRQKVKQLLNLIREGLASIIFSYGAQRELRWQELLPVLDFLKVQISPEDRHLSKDDTILIASILYSVEYNLGPPEVDMEFAHQLRKYLEDNESAFKSMELYNVFRLSLLIAVSKLPTDDHLSSRSTPVQADASYLPPPPSRSKTLIADDVDFELTHNLFGFLQMETFAHPEYYTGDENVTKVFHGYLTDIIIHLPLKLKEMKYRSEELSKTLLICHEQGLNPALPDFREYESFLECLGQFYRNDPYELGSYFYRTDPQYLSLSKLVRCCCIESPSMFVSSMNFLNGVTTGNPGAMFDLLRQSGHNASLEHFFESILKYLQTFGGNNDGRRSLAEGAGMNPLEVRGMCSYLALIENVCVRHEPARVFFTSQKPTWIRTVMQVAKIRAIPREIRACMLSTCASMIGQDVHSPEVISILWDMFYQARLIDPGTGDIKEELEDRETRLETYPVTLSMLKILRALITSRFKRMEFVSLEGYFVRPTQDNGSIFPYINFVVDAVFLKTPFRLFKDPMERWTMMTVCTEIISILLDYMPKLMMQLLCDSPLIRTLLNTIVDCAMINDMRDDVEDNLLSHIQVCSLECLNLLWRALQRQPFYMTSRQDIYDMQDSLLLIGIHELIMRTGNDTGKPEYILAIMRFIDTLMTPAHQLAAIEILHLAVEGHTEIDHHIHTTLQWQQSLASVFRHTLVEILYDSKRTLGLYSSDLKLGVLKLIRESVTHEDPNIGFFLLGVDSKKMDYEDGFKTCLHGLLDNPKIPTCFFTLATLLTDPRLSNPTLRYLRYTKFFQSYVGEVGVFGDMTFESLSYFLKCLAIELKTEGGLDTAGQLSTSCFGRLEEILGLIQLESHSVDMPDFEFFDSQLVMEAISQCEYVHPELRTSLVRVELLDGMLKEEINKLEKSTALRLRKTVHTEAKDILKFVRALNTCREKEGRKLFVFDGWRQVVEVIMLSPQTPARYEFVTNTLRIMLVKVLTSSTLNDYFFRLSAESTLTACAVLSSISQKHEQSTSVINIVINHLCQWVARTQTPNIRGVLYAALLYCVNMLVTMSGDTIVACQSSFPLVLDLLSRDCSTAPDTSKLQALYLMGEIIRCTVSRGLSAAAANALTTNILFQGADVELGSAAHRMEAGMDSSFAGEFNFNDESMGAFEREFSRGVEKAGMSSTRVVSRYTNNPYVTMEKTIRAPPGHDTGMSPSFHSLTSFTSMLDDDSGVPKARALASKASAGSAIMSCVYNNGFLTTIIESFGVVDDNDLVALLTAEVSQSAMRAFFIFEAKMSLLTRYTQTGIKAVLHVLDLSLVKRLINMKVFELQNYQSEIDLDQQGQEIVEQARVESAKKKEEEQNKTLYSRGPPQRSSPPQFIDNYLQGGLPPQQQARTPPVNPPQPKEQITSPASYEFSPSQHNISESLFTQVLKLFHAMFDAAPRNAVVAEQILEFLRVHDASISKVLGPRILVEKVENPRLCAQLLTGLMAKMSPWLVGITGTTNVFNYKTILKPSLFNILRMQAERCRLSEVGLQLVRQALLFIYYYSRNKQGSTIKELPNNKILMLTKKFELDTLIREPDENVSLGSVIQIVADCASNIANSQMPDKNCTPPSSGRETQSACMYSCVRLTDKMIDNMIQIIEIGLSLVYFHCDMFLQEMLKSPYERPELTEFRENLTNHAERVLAKPVTEACKKIPNSDYVEVVLLKLRRLPLQSINAKANLNTRFSGVF